MLTDRRRGTDRRDEERFSVKIDVDWVGHVGQKKGTISDISVTGCFIMCSGEVEDGAVKMRLDRIQHLKTLAEAAGPCH